MPGPRSATWPSKSLYIDEPLGLEELDQRGRTVYALDATTIDLCLSGFPWARFRTTKWGVKMHTLLDLRGSIPAFTWITDAKFGDVRILDSLFPEPGSIYVFDRAFVDFPRLQRLDEARAIFVTRLKRGIGWERVHSGAECQVNTVSAHSLGWALKYENQAKRVPMTHSRSLTGPRKDLFRMTLGCCPGVLPPNRCGTCRRARDSKRAIPWPATQ